MDVWWSTLFGCNVMIWSHPQVKQPFNIGCLEFQVYVIYFYIDTALSCLTASVLAVQLPQLDEAEHFLADKARRFLSMLYSQKRFLNSPDHDWLSNSVIVWRHISSRLRYCHRLNLTFGREGWDGESEMSALLFTWSARKWSKITLRWVVRKASSEFSGGCKADVWPV